MRTLTEEDYISVNSLEESQRGEWAVFRIAYSKKNFLSLLYKDTLRWHESQAVKLSDPSILKMNQEFATKVALANKEFYTKTVGIVNNKGVQIIF